MKGGVSAKAETEGLELLEVCNFEALQYYEFHKCEVVNFAQLATYNKGRHKILKSSCHFMTVVVWENSNP